MLTNKAHRYYRFNKAVARIRICSEWAIGYLKGRFQALNGLRIQIEDNEDHELAVLLVIACTICHNIVMEHEARWRAERNRTIAEGIGYHRRTGETVSNQHHSMETAPEFETQSADAGISKRQEVCAAYYSYRDALPDQERLAWQRRREARQEEMGDL